MIGSLPRFLALPVVMIATAVSVQAADTPDVPSISIEEFCRLSPSDQNSMLKRSFEGRLKAGKNIYYEALQRGRTHKYLNGKILEITHSLNGRNYKHWRLGDSYRHETEKGGVDVLKADELSNSGYNSETQTVTSTLTYVDKPRIFARISPDHNGDIRGDRYAYWLDGKPDKRSMADYIIRDLANEANHYKIEAPVEQDKVRVTIPWQPVWSNIPVGTREFILDPQKGFLPVRGTAYCKMDRPNGKPMWRDETFTVEESQLVGQVWMPTKLKEKIRASSTGENHIVVWETDVTEMKLGIVTAEDLVVQLMVGTEVVDAIEGLYYVIGDNGERLRVQPLVRLK